MNETMSKLAIHILARRLDQMERENRRLQRAKPVTLLLAAIAAGALMGYVGVSQAAETESPPERVTVQQDGVPVYSRTDTTSIVVMQLMRGDVVEIGPAETTSARAWCRVREVAIWGRSGYVRCEELKPKRPPAETPPKVTDRPKEKGPPVVGKAPEAPPLRQEPPPKRMAKVTEPEVKTEKRYTVQVASLVLERNALALKARLEQLGYRPIIRTITAPITRHQVYGGEFTSREEAERIARRLNGDGFSSNLVEAEGGKFRLKVGSFFRLDEAIDLARDLQKKNYTPKILSKAVPTPLHVVRVGEFANPSEAQEVLQALKRQGLTPLIVRR